jgi:hypothetical protein
MSAFTSAHGPNAKCRRVLNLSAFRGIPEVIAHVQKLGRYFKTSFYRLLCGKFLSSSQLLLTHPLRQGGRGIALAKPPRLEKLAALVPKQLERARAMRAKYEVASANSGRRGLLIVVAWRSRLPTTGANVVQAYIWERRCEMATIATESLSIRRRRSFGFRAPTARLTHWTTLRAKRARSSSSSATVAPMSKR